MLSKFIHSAVLSRCFLIFPFVMVSGNQLQWIEQTFCLQVSVYELSRFTVGRSELDFCWRDFLVMTSLVSRAFIKGIVSFCLARHSIGCRPWQARGLNVLAEMLAWLPSPASWTVDWTRPGKFAANNKVNMLIPRCLILSSVVPFRD